MTAHELALSWAEIETLMRELFEACRRFDYGEIRRLLIKAPLGYQPSGELCDLLSGLEFKPGAPPENVSVNAADNAAS